MSRLFFFSVDFCALTKVESEGGTVFDANNLHDELIELKRNVSKLRSSQHVPSNLDFSSIFKQEHFGEFRSLTSDGLDGTAFVSFDFYLSDFHNEEDIQLKVMPNDDTTTTERLTLR